MKEMRPLVMERNHARTTHFMLHWGLPGEIHERRISGCAVAIMEFRPPLKPLSPELVGDVDEYRYVTNGMSEIVVEPAPMELFVACRRPSPRAIRLLEMLVNYPIAMAEPLFEFDTIPLENTGLSFAALLIAPPTGFEESVGVTKVDSQVVLVHQVVGIMASEYQFALQSNNGEELWRKMSEARIGLCLDEEREPVV